jgi:hypothetical protein
MNRVTSLLTGTGLGVGMMYFLDPQKGRYRRSLLRDKMIRATHEIQDATNVVMRDMRHRIQGLSSGDYSVILGGKRALSGNPLRGSWSPSGRAMLGVIGGGMFVYGLTKQFPVACLLGTAGLALMAEGITNASIDDIAAIPSAVVKKSSEITERMAASIDHRGRSSGLQQAAMSAT